MSDRNCNVCHKDTDVSDCYFIGEDYYCEECARKLAGSFREILGAKGSSWSIFGVEISWTDVRDFVKRSKEGGLCPLKR